jgi:hypothetical protein
VELTKAKEDSGKVYTLLALGKEVKTQGNYGSAIQYATQALSLSQKLNFKKEQQQHTMPWVLLMRNRAATTKH